MDGGASAREEVSSQGEPGLQHATTATYLRVAALLAVLTLIEFGIVYVSALPGAVAMGLLLVLAATKFGMVAAFFMHLHFDYKVLRLVLEIGLGFAALIAVSVWYLVGVA